MAHEEHSDIQTSLRKELERVKFNPSNERRRHVLSLRYAELALFERSKCTRSDGLWYLYATSRQARYVKNRIWRRWLYRKSADLFRLYGRPLTAAWYGLRSRLT